MSPRATASFIVAGIVLALALAFANVFGGWGDRSDSMRDFRAFYCAGQALGRRADPYRAEPLGSCERTSPGAPISAPGFVLPAPLPGFVLGAFWLLSFAPFYVAACLWTLLLAANFGLLLWACARVVALPRLAIFLWLLPLGLLWPLKLGQLAPFAVSFGVAAAVALREDRPALAGIAASCTLIEPQIGIPACLAVALCTPRALPAMAATIAGFVAVSVAAAGWAANVEYLRAVLPAHLLAELNYDDQFGTAYLLRQIGAEPAVAIAVATVAYWIAVVAAAALCHLEAFRRDGSTIVLFPMAVAIAAGPFVHAEHLLAAVPLAMLTFTRTAHLWRAAAALGLFLLAWPPKWLLQTIGLLPPIQLDATSVAIAPSALAQTAWQSIVASQSGHLPFLLAKIPTWAALLTVPVLFAVWTLRCRRESLAG